MSDYLRAVFIVTGFPIRIIIGLVGFVVFTVRSMIYPHAEWEQGYSDLYRYIVTGRE